MLIIIIIINYLYLLGSEVKALKQDERKPRSSDSRSRCLNDSMSQLLGKPNLHTTATQRGWCIEAFVSILVQPQSPKSLLGGGGV